MPRCVKVALELLTLLQGEKEMNLQSLTRFSGTIIVTLLMVFTSLSAVAGNIQTPKSEFGGANGGGGNISKVRISTLSDVNAAIWHSEVALPVFIQTYINSVKYPSAGSVLGPSKIFSSNLSNAQKVGAALTWEIRSHNPCYYVDQPNEPKDGAANRATLTICLSVPRILNRKIPSEIVDREVLALAFHEYSHLLGANEEQANEFQAIVNSWLRTYHFGDLRDALGWLASDLENYETGIREIKNNVIGLPSDDQFDYCHAIDNLETASSVLSGGLNNSGGGFSFMSQDSFNRLTDAILAVDDLQKEYCTNRGAVINVADFSTRLDQISHLSAPAISQIKRLESQSICEAEYHRKTFCK